MIAVVRIRGSRATSERVEDTLRKLRLSRKHSLVFVDDKLSGMVRKARDYVAFGTPSAESVQIVFEKRGFVEGRKKLSDDFLKQNTRFSTVGDFAKQFLEGKAVLKDVPSLKQVFRLSPPRKGFRKSVKGHYPEGVLGNWGDKISELISKMV